MSVAFRMTRFRVASTIGGVLVLVMILIWPLRQSLSPDRPPPSVANSISYITENPQLNVSRSLVQGTYAAEQQPRSILQISIQPFMEQDGWIDLGSFAAPKTPHVRVKVEDRLAKVEAGSFELQFIAEPFDSDNVYLDRETYLAALELMPSGSLPQHLRTADKLEEMTLIHFQFTNFGNSTFTAHFAANSGILELMPNRSFIAYIWIGDRNTCRLVSGTISSQEGARQALQWLLHLRLK